MANTQKAWLRDYKAFTLWLRILKVGGLLLDEAGYSILKKQSGLSRGETNRAIDDLLEIGALSADYEPEGILLLYAITPTGTPSSPECPLDLRLKLQ